MPSNGITNTRASKNIPRIGIVDPNSWYGVLDNVAASLVWLDVKVPGGPWRGFEIADLDFVPPIIREKIQAMLTAQWNRKLPFIQRQPPSDLAAALLVHHLSLLEPRKPKLTPPPSLKPTKPTKSPGLTGIVKRAATSLAYSKPLPPSQPQQPLPDPPLTVVDFCSGAGGPTPAIEKAVNAARKAQKLPPVQFLLTDIHPPLDAWIDVSETSEYLSFVPQSVDATDPPPSVMSSSSNAAGASSSSSISDSDRRGSSGASSVSTAASSVSTSTSTSPGTRIFRTFFLSFHHFPDSLAVSVLKSTLATSDGFAIVELQSRHFSSLFLMVLEFFLVFFATVFWFWGDAIHLGLVYLVPVLPAVMAFDGVVSCLRTRDFGEVMALVDLAMEGVEGGGGRAGGGGGGGGGGVVGKKSSGQLGRQANEQGAHPKSKKEQETPHDDPVQPSQPNSSIQKISKGDWIFEGGKTLHTFPFGYLNWVVGRRVR